MLQKASLKLKERNVDFLICGDQMKRFFGKKTFNSFQILTAFLIPTIVYIIFSVDWNNTLKYFNYYHRSCRKIAKNGVEAEKYIHKNILTEQEKKQLFENNLDFCLNRAPDFYTDYEAYLKKGIEIINDGKFIIYKYEE